MKKLVLLFLFTCCIEFSFPQPYPGQIDSSVVPKLNLHALEEYSFDIIVNAERWEQQESGMNVSFGSTDKLYFRSEVPDPEYEIHSWEETGWKGERLNAVILVWSPDTLNQVRFILNDLINTNTKQQASSLYKPNDVISKNNMHLNIVHYVLSDFPYAASALYCASGSQSQAYLMPDRFVPLDSVERFDLPGKTVRPVWLSIDIPSTAEQGVYDGVIEVKSENYTALLNVKVKVQNQTLPEPKDWKFRLDLWQNPWVTAHYYNVEPWSEEHKSILEKHLKHYANAGGKFITTYAVHSAWAGVTYRIDETMIDWVKDVYGSWKFNYNIFDQYIELAMKVGIDEAITIYSPIPWGNRFRYLDEKTGNYIYEVWSPDSEEFKAFWNIFLDDLKIHLEEKGWFEKTYLGINENELSQTIAAIKVIKDHSEKWKITYAGDWHPELDSLLDDYSCVFGQEPGLNDVKERSARGSTSTYYICCTPPKPNTFVSSPPVEARWLGWYTAAYGYDGMLRWAYDSWPADPVRDARHVYWAAGDCFLVYPGANSSIRFEKLREGIVDFEKLKILQELALKSTDENVKNLLQELDVHLQSITVKNDFSEEYFNTSISKGKKILEELSDHLNQQNK
jgi:hypothetical protein